MTVRHKRLRAPATAIVTRVINQRQFTVRPNDTDEKEAILSVKQGRDVISLTNVGQEIHLVRRRGVISHWLFRPPSNRRAAAPTKHERLGGHHKIIPHRPLAPVVLY